jgi:hypothetical protein
MLLLKFLYCQPIIEFIKVSTIGKTSPANTPLSLETEMFMQSYRSLVEAGYLNRDLLIGIT